MGLCNHFDKPALTGSLMTLPQLAAAAQVSRRACAPDRSARPRPEDRPPSATQMISHSSSYPYARPGMTHRDEWNVRRWIKPRILPAKYFR
jgi:hypothetical protein